MIGIVLGTLITIRFGPLQAVIRFYIEVWRGLPILVTVLFIYWMATAQVGGSGSSSARSRPPRSPSLGKRAGCGGDARVVQSIPREQHEAAFALGFGWVGRHAFVIVPQALRRLIPPMVGLLVNIIQNTTIASVIGVAEVLETANRQFENLTLAGDGHPIMIFGFVMAIFFLISFPLTRLAAYLERRLV